MVGPRGKGSEACINPHGTPFSLLQNIVAKGVKISTDQFFPQKISTKKARFTIYFLIRDKTA